MEKRIILDEQDMNEFTKIFAKTIEDEAIKQIETLSNSEAYNSCKIRIMPDCHAGKGCTIGTVIELDKRVVPNTVGVDIGCGMKVVRLGKVNINLQKFDEAVNTLIPSGFNINEEASAYIHGLVDGNMFGKFRSWDSINGMDIVYRSVGSLGGGNHFIELDANEEGEKFLVIHTGSRNLGVMVCNYYQKLAYQYCHKKAADKSEVIAKLKSEGREKEIQSVIKSLGTKNISKELSYLEGDLLNDYLNDMRIVQKYAEQNRMIIANRLVNALGVDIDANSDTYSFTTIHNYIDTDKGILRKGAISAKKDEVVIIPMNMRDGSLICKGKGNKEWLCSAPHGAGRLMSRTQAKKELSMDSYKNEMNGIYSSSVCEETIDEAPMAYKSTEEIVELIKPTVDVIDVIKPIYNFKAKL